MSVETSSSGVDPSYAGERSADQAWEILQAETGACLVDVRTRAEWSYVGLSDLSSIGKQPILVEWQHFPQMQVNGNFVAELVAKLEAAGRDDPAASMLFLCRSGVRSLAAARAMTAYGYTNCFNVTGGFEGPKDGNGHRGGTDGWKARGLPWIQG